MKKAKFLRLLRPVVFFIFFNFGINISPVWSQRTSADLTTTLLKGSKCVFSSTYNGTYSSFVDNNIAVGHQIYSSFMSLFVPPNYAATMTCKVSDPKHLSLLKLKMGVPDDDVKLQSVMAVNIYQGGDKKHTYDLVPGKIVDATLDLQDRSFKSPENVAIELVCQRTASYCNLHFFQAQLLPNPNTISPKSFKRR